MFLIAPYKNYGHEPQESQHLDETIGGKPPVVM
jgi:hypothetical protein